MAFTVSMFESALPTGCPDIFAGGGGGSFPSFEASSLCCGFPDGQDSLMMMNASSSSSEVRTGNDEVRTFDDRHTREMRDSWLFEMLFGTQSSTGDEEVDLRNVDRSYDLDLDNIDFDAHLLSGPLPSGKGPTEVVLPTIGCRSSPLSSGESVGGNETVNEIATAGEEDWNVLMSFDDWGEVCDDEALLAGDDLTLKSIWREAEEEIPAKRKLCDDDGDKDISDGTSLAAVAAAEQGSDTHQLSPDLTTLITSSSAALKHITNKRIEVATPESTRSFDTSSWTTPFGSSSFRANPPAQLNLSRDQSSRPRNYPRTVSSPQQRTSSTTAPATTQSTAHHMLEDHRYSSRRIIDQVVKPVHTTMTTTARQLEVDKSSKYSVLETLLRTSVRFNPNHGSSFIVTKESKKRSLNHSTTISPQTAKQPTPIGHQATKRHNHNNNNNNTLLHNLLTCRMEEVERKRGGNHRKSGPGKDHHLAAGKTSLVVGLIPSDDPVVDCSFLYDGDQDLNVEEHNNVDTRMAWMEKVMEEDYDDKVSTQELLAFAS